MFGLILFLESLGGGELLVIMLFVLIFFGSKNIPSLARGLGKGIREFKDAMNGVQSEIRQGMNEVERQVEQAGSPEPAKKMVSPESPEATAAQISDTPAPAPTPSILPPASSQTRE
jgi:sec-independent protein translocase protein TatA